MADNPYLLAEEDKDKVSRASKSHLRTRTAIIPAIFNMRTNWSLIPVATPAWAKGVFPHDGNAAHGRLWHSIFESTRVNLPDAAAASVSNGQRTVMQVGAHSAVQGIHGWLTAGLIPFEHGSIR
jgi:leucyl aminopeptidase (aminopeptidase T)